MLEAVASYYLWIWHAFFGMADSNNDINVLNQSPVLNKLKNGTSPPAPFEVNDHEYTKRYYLADGCREAFGVLQGRFHILRLATRTMSVNNMRRVMECCVILHNMILEDTGFTLSDWDEAFITEDMENLPERISNRGRDQYIIIREIIDKAMHDTLTEDLVEHIWNIPSTFRTMN
ncbi:uncharacterized protein [Rutidosis leptorrhynchoides]|uniref:uncharacterized protein n=1 Tax=Rutidosis leptorrhynchoides TaxID=125765 RepID=UPI003A992BDC